MSAEKKRIVKRSKTNSVMELVASRLGVTPQELEREVSGKCKNVLNIAGLDKAVDLFWSMIDSPVYVYCDYDCDGITSGSIISIGCNSIGIKPHIIIPRRFTDGYGIKVKNLENMDPSGLLITVDNGIAANEAVDTAKEKGMKVIILDHHEARILNLEVQFKTKVGWSAQPTLFRLKGTVLRVIPAGKSRVNVGCRLTRADANLGKFIAAKQREMLTTERNKKN